MLTLELPKDIVHPQVRVVVRSTSWSGTFSFDNSFRSISIPLPDGVTPDEVEAYMEYLDNRGEIDTAAGKHVLKTIPRPRRGKPTRG